MSTREQARQQYRQLVDWMNDGTPYSFPRYGDGEFAAIFQTRPGGSNCDKHAYYPEMGRELRRTLDASHSDFAYCYALQQAGVMDPLRDRVTKAWPGLFVWNAAVFHYASIDGNLAGIVNALRNQKVCLVGPKHLTRLPFLVTGGQVIVPERNCYTEKARIEADLKGMIQNRNASVIAFSASMLTCILIHQLYPLFRNKWLIDFGSVWEPYTGVRNRKYHSGLTKEKLEKNLRVE